MRIKGDKKNIALLAAPASNLPLWRAHDRDMGCTERAVTLFL